MDDTTLKPDRSKGTLIMTKPLRDPLVILKVDKNGEFEIEYFATHTGAQIAALLTKYMRGKFKEEHTLTQLQKRTKARQKEQIKIKEYIKEMKQKEKQDVPQRLTTV